MLDGVYIGKYKGKSMCGFIHNHKYQIDIDKNLYGYIIDGIRDITDEEHSGGTINYASEISIRQRWELEE